MCTVRIPTRHQEPMLLPEIEVRSSVLLFLHAMYEEGEDPAESKVFFLKTEIFQRIFRVISL
jgi:hypothetical protein